MSQYDINFEEFEVIPGASLNPDDEQCLIDTLHVALNMLDGMRSSKKKTLEYCNKNYHLPPGKKCGPFSSDDFCFMIPSEDSNEDGILYDFSLDGKLFLYALFSLVQKEKYRFGYLWNFLNDELYARRITTWHFEPVSDNAVRFAAKYDYVDLAKYLREESDIPIKDRYLYITRILTDCKASAESEFTKEEMMKLVDPTLQRIELLRQEAESELRLSEEQKPASTALVEHPDQATDSKDVPLLPINEAMADDDDEVEEELYNSELLGSTYNKVGIDNRTAFLHWLESAFENDFCYDKSSGSMRCDFDKIAQSCNTLENLFHDYFSRLERSKRRWNYMFFIGHISNWIKTTFECLDTAYERHSVIYYDNTDEYGIGKTCYIDTCVLKHSLAYYLFGVLLEHRDQCYDSLPPEYDKVISYNFWPDTFVEDYNRYQGQVGLTPENRAKVNMLANHRYFKKWLSKYCDLYIDRSRTKRANPNVLLNSLEDSVSSKIHELFYDYTQRAAIQNPMGNEDDRANAGLLWLFNTMYNVKVTLDNRYSHSRNICLIEPDNDRDIYDHFFLECCLRRIASMLSDFVEDNVLLHTDDGLSPWRPPGSAKAYDPDDPDVNCFIEPGDEESLADGAEDTDSDPEATEKKRYYARGMATINVAVIYNHVASLIKTSLKQEDFGKAIDYADFSALQADGKNHRAKEYPQVIICKLKDLFDDDWYYACCQSLKMEPTKVSGYHRDGRILTLSNHFPGNLTMK